MNLEDDEVRVRVCVRIGLCGASVECEQISKERGVWIEKADSIEGGKGSWAPKKEKVISTRVILSSFFPFLSHS